MTDTNNPPGQIRYLRDVIKKYQEPQEAISPKGATTPLTDAEKRLQSLVGALLKVCKYNEEQQFQSMLHKNTCMHWVRTVRQIISENT